MKETGCVCGVAEKSYSGSQISTDFSGFQLAGRSLDVRPRGGMADTSGLSLDARKGVRVQVSPGVYFRNAGMSEW